MRSGRGSCADHLRLRAGRQWEREAASGDSGAALRALICVWYDPGPMRRLAPVFLGLVLLPTGCNRSPPPQVPVRGQVLVNGQALRGGTVVFTPDDKRGARGPVSFAVLDGAGAFILASENGPG